MTNQTKRKEDMNKENTLWNSAKELEYQVGFDKPIFKREEPKKELEKPKSPRPTQPIKRPSHHGTVKKHP